MSKGKELSQFTELKRGEVTIASLPIEGLVSDLAKKSEAKVVDDLYTLEEFGGEERKKEGGNGEGRFIVNLLDGVEKVEELSDGLKGKLCEKMGVYANILVGRGKNEEELRRLLPLYLKRMIRKELGEIELSEDQEFSETSESSEDNDAVDIFKGSEKRGVSTRKSKRRPEGYGDYIKERASVYRKRKIIKAGGEEAFKLINAATVKRSRLRKQGYEGEVLEEMMSKYFEKRNMRWKRKNMGVGGGGDGADASFKEEISDTDEGGIIK